MAAIIPSPPALEPLPQQRPTEPGPAAEAANDRIADDAAAPPRVDLAPNVLQVRLDEAAGRFVQTLTDVETEETLRRWPSEAQLAYSRAVMAYLRAQIGK